MQKIILAKENTRELRKWAYLNVDGQNKLLEVGTVVKVVVVDVVLVLIKSFLLLTAAIRRTNVFMVMVRNLRVAVSIGAAVATMPIGRRVDKLSTPLAVVEMATNPISFCVRFTKDSFITTWTEMSIWGADHRRPTFHQQFVTKPLLTQVTTRYQMKDMDIIFLLIPLTLL